MWIYHSRNAKECRRHLNLIKYSLLRAWFLCLTWRRTTLAHIWTWRALPGILGSFHGWLQLRPVSAKGHEATRTALCWRGGCSWETDQAKDNIIQKDRRIQTWLHVKNCFPYFWGYNISTTDVVSVIFFVKFTAFLWYPRYHWILVQLSWNKLKCKVEPSPSHHKPFP